MILGRDATYLRSSEELQQRLMKAVEQMENTIVITSLDGTITLQSSSVGESAEVRISDAGCGLPAEVSTRILEPFYMAKEVGRGTGQGLPISHTVIVAKHGGSIGVESDRGAGRASSFVFPCETRAERTPPLETSNRERTR